MASRTVRSTPSTSRRPRVTSQDEWTRGYVADATELLPLLQSLADDVTLPLIARNRAGDLAKQIAKQRGK